MLNKFLIVKSKHLLFIVSIIILITILGVTIVRAKASAPLFFSWEKQNSQDFIKWVDFNPTYEAMLKAMSFDIKSHVRFINTLRSMCVRFTP